MPVRSKNPPRPACVQPGLLVCIIIIVLGLSSPRVFAVNDLSLALGRIEFQDMIAEDVVVAIDLGTAGEAVTFLASAKNLLLNDIPVLEVLEVSCARGRMTSTLLGCTDAVYNASHNKYGKLSGQIDLLYQLDGKSWQLGLQQTSFGTATVAGNLKATGDNWDIELQADNIELNALYLLADLFGLWPKKYSGASGAIDISVTASGTSDKLQQIQGNLVTHDVGFYGTHAAEVLNAETSFDLQFSDQWQIRSEGQINAGAAYIDAGFTAGNVRPGIALEIAGEPLRFAVNMELDRGQQQVSIKQLDIYHPGVMTSKIRMDAKWATDLSTDMAELELSVVNADLFYTTYLQPFLLNSRFNNMEMVGAFASRVRVNSSGLAHLDLQLADIDVRDKNGRFNIAGLQGTLGITDASTPVTSTLGWRGAGLYRLVFGAGKLVLESSGQGLNIVSWDDVPVLDGQLKIDSLDIINPGESDMTVRLDGTLTPVSMEQFTTTMGWPVMSGELKATIAGLTYSQGQLVVDGQIDLGLFDGNVHVSNLRIEDLFDLVPKLYADIDVERVNLELLTNRFTFGQIQGHLSGKVHKLELQAWQPVYFEAAFATPADDPTRHRISQKAVENLGYIGGGAGGALSTGFLRIFKNYSYGEMGISCRLFNGSCEMGGVGMTEDGFIIVSRGGLLPPWIEVKGNGHSINWITLIEGIKTITSNQPEFE